MPRKSSSDGGCSMSQSTPPGSMKYRMRPPRSSKKFGDFRSVGFGICFHTVPPSKPSWRSSHTYRLGELRKNRASRSSMTLARILAAPSGETPPPIKAGESSTKACGRNFFFRNICRLCSAEKNAFHASVIFSLLNGGSFCAKIGRCRSSQESMMAQRSSSTLPMPALMP